LRALQLAQQMPQAVILRQRLVTLGKRGIALHNHRVALGTCCRDQRMQGCDIGRKRISALVHAPQ